MNQEHLAEPADGRIRSTGILQEPGSNEADLAGLARRAAANDPAGAERIFARLTQRPARLNVLADLCAGMAERDLPRALALAMRAVRRGSRP